MTSPLYSFDSEHTDIIHDAQFDFYGRNLATCSSDGSIKLWDISDTYQKLITELKGHDGPVWQVSWAHPKFGRILASCSYDRKVIIWREVKNKWSIDYTYKAKQSVNSISWAPKEFGLMLALACSDGGVTILSTENEEWKVLSTFQAHEIGANSVSWAPTNTDSLEGNQHLRIVTGGCDNLVKIWHLSQENGWETEAVLEGHTDWVRDVAWAPSTGLPNLIIASGGQDGCVLIWTKAENSDIWNQQQLQNNFDVVWRISWSNPGNILAVSSGDNKVSLWKEGLEQDWVCITDQNSFQKIENPRI